MISQQDFQQQLDALTAEFRSTLPARLAQIERHWDRLSGPPANRNDRTELTHELQRELHSLAGSAQVFGFGALGDAARRAEHALASRTGRRGVRLPTIMEEALQAMREQLEIEPERVEIRVRARGVLHH